MKNTFSQRIGAMINQYSIFITIFVLIFVLLVGWFLLLGPKYRAIEQSGGFNYLASQKELEQKRLYLEQLKQLQEKYNKLNQDALENLQYVLPKGNNVPELLVALEALAEDNGLRLVNIDVSASETTTQTGAQDTSETAPSETLTETGTPFAIENADIRKVNVTFSVEGIDSYEALKTFLGELERNMRLMDLHAFQYREGTKSYALNLTTYYLAE